ncbi:MAG: hypothetical protein FJ315_09575, partial [SAR202 cluster bacterium]|nr:hypothetical protein [SAR202 cluster bacterium]
MGHREGLAPRGLRARWELREDGLGQRLFDRWEQGTRVRVKRNPNYWRLGDDRQPLPYVDSLDALVISDPATHVAALRAGQLDFAGITGITSTQVGPLRGVRGLNLIPGHPMFVGIVAFNHSVKPLDDVRVRKALLQGMDIRFLMRNALQAPDMPLESFVYSVAPKDLTYPQDKLEKIFTRDVAAAKQSLAAAGLGSGLKLELLIVFNRPPYPQEAALLKQQWAEIGVDLSLATGTDIETNVRYREGRYQLMVWTQNLLGDAVTMLDTQWKTGASRNFFRYSNPRADQVIADAKREFDRARLKQLLDRAQDLLWDDVAGIPISPGLNYQVQWEWLKGYVNQYAWGNQGLKFAWSDR